jgi:hypothetical protein
MSEPPTIASAWWEYSLVPSTCTRVSSKQSYFWGVWTKTNRNSICFGCFLVCIAKPKKFFWFVSVYFSVSDQYWNNRNKQNFVETRNKPQKSQKMFSIRRSSKQLIFFSRFELKQTKTQYISIVFWFVFSQNHKKIFWFGLVFQTSIKTTETNRTYSMRN